MTDNDPYKVQDAWSARAEALGGTERAVLLKGLPDSANDMIGRWHKLVLRFALTGTGIATGGNEKQILDIGCGYGRMASEAYDLGFSSLVGIDYAPAFCRIFERQYGRAVCGNLAQLPFAEGCFSHAYCITSLMYLDAAIAQQALRSLDRCLRSGAYVLLLEPGAEFNSLVRKILKRRAREDLARPGFTLAEFDQQLAPQNWQRIACGSNFWGTVLLPSLLLFAWSPRISRLLTALCLHMDRPGKKQRWALPDGLALHRWALYRTP